MFAATRAFSTNSSSRSHCFAGWSHGTGGVHGQTVTLNHQQFLVGRTSAEYVNHLQVPPFSSSASAPAFEYQPSDKNLWNKETVTPSQPKSYLGNRQIELIQDVQTIQVQIESANEELARQQKDIHNCETYAEKRAKICSNCHGLGHTKAKCPNEPCLGFDACKLSSKHPEIKKELLELKNLIKQMEKRKIKAQSDLEAFKFARERASTSFFSVMRPRLKQQNAVKYINRSALDKDLLILKKALGNKIPLGESRDWELPFIIERFKKSDIDIYNMDPY